MRVPTKDPQAMSHAELVEALAVVTAKYDGTITANGEMAEMVVNAIRERDEARRKLRESERDLADQLDRLEDAVAVANRAEQELRATKKVASAGMALNRDNTFANRVALDHAIGAFEAWKESRLNQSPKPDTVKRTSRKPT